MVEASEEMQKYFAGITGGLERAYAIASEARGRGFDPENFVEITPAADVAGRVEGIVGPKGIAALIREIEKEEPNREVVAYRIVKKIVEGELSDGKRGRDELIDQAVRSGVAILTEGVLVAPTEGIARIKVKQNPDGSEYLSMYFSGPIRSAGGTVAALAVVLGDVARRHFGVSDYRPTEDELERYVEEVNMYDARAARLQYKPAESEIKHIVKNCPVCVDGEPTEKFEVAVKRDLPRVETNRIRGGIALVVCEGIAQKAAKVMKYAKKIGVDWSWLEEIVKVAKKEGGAVTLKPNDKYLEDIVAGRPIFAYPMRPGGFRLRYGRTRATGIMGKALHPASMMLLDNFVAVGTQMKVERPGKSTVISPCDSIEGPVVKLSDGSVVQVKSAEEAERVRGSVAELLFLGDILVSVGDFIKSNHPLVPGAWCFEWYAAEAEAKGLKAREEMPVEEAFRLAKEKGLPLHPSHTYFWHDITSRQLKELAEWLKGGKLVHEWFKLKSLRIESSPAKRILEVLCVPHSVEKGEVVVGAEEAAAVLRTLGMLADGKIAHENFEKIFDENKDAMENVNGLAGVPIRKKAPVYVGARMGRPEKAKEREMKPAVHALFPLGMNEKSRSVSKLYKRMKEKGSREGEGAYVEIARMRCRACGKIGFSARCACGGKAEPELVCTKCRKISGKAECACGGKAVAYEKRAVNIVELVDGARKRCERMPDDVKGVKGLVSSAKIPEMLEKGVLRAVHDVSVFRDGTCRFDATDMPLTHFKPKEIGITVEKAKELGYERDYLGNPLGNEEQLLELKPQDILVSESGKEYLTRVAQFVDDELVCVYGMKPFYNIKKSDELVGQLTVTLSPHTSAGVLSRIVGFTKARVGYAHPYLITARRRNCDGDEDAAMLLMDALLNFSRKFLPESRGGTMDAPLVMTTVVNPKEVDDEVHAMEIGGAMPLEFYEAAEKFAAASEAGLKIVKSRLGTAGQYEGLLFSHETSSIDAGPVRTTYVEFRNMNEKVDAQFRLEAKIRAVDPKDVAERVILGHFLPDLYGNLRSFSRQIFRCVDCNSKYRRVPLVGKCTRCGGKLLLTINKGGIEKYLKISQQMVEKYGLPDYLKQRLSLIEKDIESVFVDEKQKQAGLTDFM